MTDDAQKEKPLVSDKCCVVRVYGDSLAMPRAAAGIPFDQTYPELFCAWLRTRFPDRRVHLYNRSQGGARIRKLYDEFQMDSIYFGTPGGDILVLQLGIVDCAPRPIPGWMKFLIGRLPSPVRSPIVKILHAARPTLLKAGCRFRTTSRSGFTRLYGKWLRKASKDFARIYVIGVLPTTPNIEQHSPGLGRSIEECNRDLRGTISEAAISNVTFIDPHPRTQSDAEKFVDSADGHHLTHEGHRLLADLLIEQEKRLTS